MRSHGYIFSSQRHNSTFKLSLLQTSFHDCSCKQLSHSLTYIMLRNREPPACRDTCIDPCAWVRFVRPISMCQSITDKTESPQNLVIDNMRRKNSIYIRCQHGIRPKYESNKRYMGGCFHLARHRPSLFCPSHACKQSSHTVTTIHCATHLVCLHFPRQQCLEFTILLPSRVYISWPSHPTLQFSLEQVLCISDFLASACKLCDLKAQHHHYWLLSL